MSTNNILSLPFHHTQALSLSSALGSYITKNHTHQHPDLFRADLKTLDELRSAAVSIADSSITPGGVLPLQKYAAQLTWLSGNRVPLDIGAEFVWYTNLADTQRVLTVDNLRFELANIVYNLAALYSHLATSANRATPDGLKNAANWFCAAAGVVKHLAGTVVPAMRTSSLPEDMEPLALECLLQLMLAQAQECFWAKAVKDGYKDGTIAKLAAKVSDYYAAAADAGRQSDAISARWLHHLQAKQSHFIAAAQFRAACDCLEKRQYGEEVARLQEAQECASSALRRAGSRISKSVIADLQGLKTRVDADFKRAEKDNNLIYLEPVPTKSELKTLGRADMVAPRCPAEVSDPLRLLGQNDSHGLGKPLFANLVPHSVHLAIAIYANRRDSHIDSAVDDLEALTARIHSLLQSLNLPGSLQALEKPLGLPPGLASHAEEIRQQNGYERLRKMMQDIDKLKANDRTIFQEAMSFLETEHEEDEQARKKYGTDRWSLPESAAAASSLYAQVEQVRGYFDSAQKSDETVRQTGMENEDMIKLLSGTDHDLERFVPSSASNPSSGAATAERNKLRAVLNDITRLEGQRKRKIDALRSKAAADNVQPDLLAEATRLQREAPMQPIEAAQFEQLFDERLKHRYEAELLQLLQTERTDQQALLSRLAEANTAFVTARQQMRDSKHAGPPDGREMALQRLENAYFAYKEIVQNLEVGRKFYNDLAGIVAKLRDDARAFAYKRRSEAVQLESDIVSGDELMRGAREVFRGLSLSEQGLPEGGAAEKAEQTQVRSQTQKHVQRAPPAPVQPSGAMTQASTPTPATTTAASQTQAQLPAQAIPGPKGGMWTPEMGIAFAGVTTPSTSTSASATTADMNGGEVVANVNNNRTGSSGGPSAEGYPNRDKRWDPTRGLRFS